MSIQEKYINAFLDEAYDLVENLNATLLEYESDKSNKAFIDPIFRYLHSIKSEAGIIGFQNLSELAHKFEDIIDYVRTHNVEINSKIMDKLFKTVDFITESLNYIATNKKELPVNEELKKEIDEIIENLEELILESGQENGKEEIVEGKKQIEETKEIEGTEETKEIKEKIDESTEIIEKSEKNFAEICKFFNIEDEVKFEIYSIRKSINLYHVKIKILKSSPMMYARAFLVYNNLSATGDIIATIPDMDQMDKPELFENTHFLLKTSPEIPQQAIRTACDVDEIERIELNKIEISDDEGIESIKMEEIDEKILESPNIKKEGENKKYVEKGNNVRTTLTSIGKNTIRVDIDRLDTLNRLVGEIIINRAKITQNIEYIREGRDKQDILNLFEEAQTELYRITDELQNIVMKLRMIPIGTIFDRFKRVVRDFSKKLNKNIEIKIIGAETEIDKKVIDEIQDPLTHIIRNAIDHGIETENERRVLGKNPVGSIVLKAYQEGSNIIIEISDDGRGIDIEKIRKKAEKMGLIEPDTHLTQSELYSFLFRSGFSTKEKVTDLSGRGVGLDVVKEHIERLRGKIELFSEKGFGTTIKIILPLTLTILEVLLVTSNDKSFSIPIYTVEQTDRVPISNIEKLEEFDVLRYRDEIYSVLYLSELIGEGKKIKIEDNLVYIVILRYNNRKICLLIDNLIGDQEIVLQPLDKVFENTPGISGVALLGDGSISLVLNIPEIVSNYVEKNAKLFTLLSQQVDLSKLHDELIDKYKNIKESSYIKNEKKEVNNFETSEEIEEFSINDLT